MSVDGLSWFFVLVRHTRFRGYDGSPLPSDSAIVAARKLMEKAIRDIQDGREPPHVLRTPEQNDLSHLLVISDLFSGVSDWKKYTRQQALGTSRNFGRIFPDYCLLPITYFYVLKFGYPASAALAL